MTNHRGLDSVAVLGVEVDRVTMGQTLAILDGFIAAGRPHQVVTVNPEFIMETRRNPQFRDVLNRADLAVPDGIGLLAAARVLGRPLRERVAGVDLVRALASLAAARGYRLFLLGAGPGVAEATAERLRAANPALQIAGTFAGTPSPGDEADIIARIRTAHPDVLLVAYGAPRQDLWIARNQPSLGVPVAMGVGGTFDFVAGKARRAPQWIQRAGLEWLFRLLREPWRWRRMLALPRFAALVLRERVAGRR